MDFAFFESLTSEEAREYLDGFLSIEKAAVVQDVDAARADGISLMFSVEGLLRVLEWYLGRVEIRPTPFDDSLPRWIRHSDAYLRGCFEIAETSKPAVMRAAYYLGETFVKEFTQS